MIINIENGKKITKFSLATNESCKNAEGEKQLITEAVISELLLLVSKQ